jgi:hypothetical protein
VGASSPLNSTPASDRSLQLAPRAGATFAFPSPAPREERPHTTAIVKLEGKTYVCEECRVEAGAVHVHGRLRVRTLAGDHVFSLTRITVPISRVERVEWLDDGGTV